MMSGLKAVEMDRISDLPRPILHHILSSLSQIDAVKTCVLSKSWRYIWHGRPIVEFRKEDFKGLTVENFGSVLEQTLTRYDNQNLSIQQFILKMSETTNDSFSAPFLETWIPIILIRNIKVIETFHLSSHCLIESEYFDMPSIVFLCESLREISLKGCKLNQINSTDKVLFRHLQKLRLHHVRIADETFERIMSSCPLLEEVSLNKCKGFKTIKLNNHSCSLKHFEFWSWGSDARIEIAEVSSIETINIMDCWDWFERHYYNNLFTNLKSLRLNGVKLNTKSVDIFSCNFPRLEELELMGCFGDVDEFRLSSHSIKRFAIEPDFDDPIKLSIDAPNIFNFEYKGFDFPSNISFTTTSNKWKSKIDLWTNTCEIDYIKLDELLKVLSRSETSLHIEVYRSEDHLRVYGELYSLIDDFVKHLELCLGSLCSDYSVCLVREEVSTIEKWEGKKMQSKD